MVSAAAKYEEKMQRARRSKRGNVAVEDLKGATVTLRNVPGRRELNGSLVVVSSCTPDGIYTVELRSGERIEVSGDSLRKSAPSINRIRAPRPAQERALITSADMYETRVNRVSALNAKRNAGEELAVQPTQDVHMLAGIRSRPELNGLRAVVCEFDASCDRYVVWVDSIQKHLMIRNENVVKMGQVNVKSPLNRISKKAQSLQKIRFMFKKP